MFVKVEFYPDSFLMYNNIDGLNNILNKYTIGGSLGGKRINHLLCADELCIVSLSSAGLQQYYYCQFVINIVLHIF